MFLHFVQGLKHMHVYNFRKEQKDIVQTRINVSLVKVNKQPRLLKCRAFAQTTTCYLIN